ncbi:hypothetical protein IRJ41_013140 [Triplophysa rosa]|uniref:Uncharacterized protein n=1 Tax=Triplophysa rosa TaxID=992332 RepID=A0A9W8C1D3_TRIRA|nr:hypothetical protein IRJ41_013140 [Triplophysa rosa]
MEDAADSPWSEMESAEPQDWSCNITFRKGTRLYAFRGYCGFKFKRDKTDAGAHGFYPRCMFMYRCSRSSARSAAICDVHSTTYFHQLNITLSSKDPEGSTKEPLFHHQQPPVRLHQTNMSINRSKKIAFPCLRLFWHGIRNPPQAARGTSGVTRRHPTYSGHNEEQGALGALAQPTALPTQTSHQQLPSPQARGTRCDRKPRRSSREAETAPMNGHVAAADVCLEGNFMGELQEDSFLTFGDYAAGLKSLHPLHREIVEFTASNLEKLGMREKRAREMLVHMNMFRKADTTKTETAHRPASTLRKGQHCCSDVETISHAKKCWHYDPHYVSTSCLDKRRQKRLCIVAEVNMTSGFTNPRTGGDSHQVWWHLSQDLGQWISSSWPKAFPPGLRAASYVNQGAD